MVVPIAAKALAWNSRKIEFNVAGAVEYTRPHLTEVSAAQANIDDTPWPF
jgi:hypothetical protein